VTNPVPGYEVSTPYGLRSTHWSCSPDSRGWGIHTGVDIAAPAGVLVVAARPGRVEHVNFGSAFGGHQLVVVPDGGGGRDFYAHMRSRVTHGKTVRAGDPVGEIGTEGNATGPHLHFERHTVAAGGWACGIVTDPAPSLNYQGSDDMPDSFSGSVCAVKLPADQWVNVEWAPVNDPGDVIHTGDDPAGLRLGGRAYALNIHLTCEVAAGVIRVRTVERSGGETTETHRVNEHTVTAGDTLIQDTRLQRAADGARVRVQVRADQGGRLAAGGVFGLLW
jgi:hypothetical protein